jgi:hypothetical protein
MIGVENEAESSFPPDRHCAVFWSDLELDSQKSSPNLGAVGVLAVLKLFTLSSSA